MCFRSDEEIEVLTPEGKWVKGIYMFPSIENEDTHVVKCITISYFPGIRIPRNKIRKIVSK